MLAPGFDPAATAVVEGDPRIDAASSGTAPGAATYTEVRPEDVRIDAFANGPSLVLVRNAWDEGWAATVDGQPAPVLRADVFLQGVARPAGQHEVRLVYREPAIGIGLALRGRLARVRGRADVRDREGPAQGRRRSRRINGTASTRPSAAHPFFAFPFESSVIVMGVGSVEIAQLAEAEIA